MPNYYQAALKRPKFNGREDILLPVNGVLWNMARKLEPTPARKPKPAAKARHNSTYTDEQAAHLRWLMERGGWHWEHLAEALGASRVTIHNIWRGHTNGRAGAVRAKDPAALFGEAAARIEPKIKCRP